MHLAGKQPVNFSQRSALVVIEDDTGALHMKSTTVPSDAVERALARPFRIAFGSHLVEARALHHVSRSLKSGGSDTVVLFRLV